MRKLLTLLTLAAVISGCGGGGSSSGGGDKDNPAPAPVKTVLLAPAQNELCTQGTVLSATQSTVTLKWNTAANADSYQVSIKDLDAGTTVTQNTANTQVDVNLKRNTPYSWSVISKSTKNSAAPESDTWKFYNSGPAATNYAPFPADLTAPGNYQVVTTNNGKVTLSWKGNDVDNDIVSYDVYFGTGDTGGTYALVKAGVTVTSYDVDAAKGNTYLWKIVTIDSKGNKSESDYGTFSAK